MDLSIIPRDFHYASPTQLKFLKSATVREICNTYNKYRSIKDNNRMKDTIESTRNFLEILESQGLVYSFYDGATSWLCFDAIEQTKAAPTTIVLERKLDPIVMNPTDAGPFAKDKDVKEDAEDNSAPPELTYFDKPAQSDFTKIIVAADEEDVDGVLNPDLKVSNPLLWKYKVATKYTNIIRSAVRRQLEFNLDMADVEDLVSQKRCFYTGVAFDEKNILTFDRVDNSKGYVKGNVVACTTQANALKNSLYEMTGGMFTDIAALKRFVDIIYIGMSKENDVLADLLLFK